MDIGAAKTLIIIPYFGKWPKWFVFFMKSCEFNPEVNWLFYTDCRIPKKYPPNIRFFKATLGDFNILASKKIGVEVSIAYPYKLCDFRPALGNIFEDFLGGYDFWGWGDMDVIYGDIKKFITPEMLSEYEIITASKIKLFGPLTLLKNTPKIRELYKTGDYYWTIFTENKSYSFDENLELPGEKALFTDPGSVAFSELKSFTYIVNKLWFEKKLTVFGMEKSIHMNSGSKKILYKFENGKLTDENNKREILFSHFGAAKQFIGTRGKAGNKFYVTDGCQMSFMDKAKKRLGMKYKSLLISG